MRCGDRMKQDVINDTPSAARVLSMKPSDVPPFVRQCLRERSLSVLIRDLNRDLLFGTETQRTDARLALSQLGFL